jgi:methylenetetrahydrofolate dehydrogenase (NADP+) / methenyltetrahydrofolate cyclohydrolase
MSNIIDGRAIAKATYQELRKSCEAKDIQPHLTVVLVGEDPASIVYIGRKGRIAKKIGFSEQTITFPESIQEQDLLECLEQLNQDASVDGILVQLPLPKHMNTKKVLECIDFNKDVDGFHPVNVGRLHSGTGGFVPCTAQGVIDILDDIENREKDFSIEGKVAVVIGRSNIVGRPVAALLEQRNATVILCHSRTRNLSELTILADILVVAVGRPQMISKQHIKKGCIVIDVGINRMEDGSLVGDVDFESCKEKASYITPVPGGVGPLTIANLLKNTFVSHTTKKRTLI